MQKKLFILVLSFLSFQVQAQIIENKLDVSFGYGTGDFQGGKLYRDGVFSAPSLFSNYEQFQSHSLKCLRKVHPNFSIGLGADVTFGDDWNLNYYTDYNTSRVSLFDLYPIFRVQNRYEQHGLFNRLKCFAELSPVFGQSRYQIQNQQSYELNVEDEDVTEWKSVDYYYGIKGVIGIDYSFNDYFGFFCSYALKYNRVSSPTLYVDDHFYYTQLSVGLTLKLQMNKRYFY